MAIALWRATLSLLALTAPVCALAQGFSIKEFTFGGELRQQAEKAGLRCGPGPVARPSTAEWCQAKEFDRAKWSDSVRTLASVPSEFVLVSGYDNILGNVYWTFAQSGFATLRSAFQEAYPGMKCIDSTVQNRMGASFEQTACTHRAGSVTLTIERRGSDLTKGRLTATTDDYELRAEQDRRKATGEAKKDI